MSSAPQWSFPPCRGFGLHGSEMCMLLVLRIRETSNPEMPMDSPFGIFPEGLDFCHASPQDGRSTSFRDFTKSNAEMSYAEMSCPS
jgi:hypothetical protein